MKNFILVVLVLFFQQFSMYSQSDAAKYLDAIYQEKDVPEYVLPELLTSFNGQKIDSKEVWENVRRPELMKFFGENIYGKVPIPSDPIVTKSEVISEDKSFMEGLCTRREIQITLSNKFGKVWF